jgi:hypothetical protein
MAWNREHLYSGSDDEAFERQRQHHSIFLAQNPDIAEKQALALALEIRKHGISYLQLDGSVLHIAPVE